MTISTSTFLQNKILDAVIGYYPFSSFLSATPYIALYTSNPTEDDTGTELSPLTTGSGYRRQPFILDEMLNSGSAWNKSAVVFPMATGSWSPFSYIGIRSGSEAGIHSGSLLYFGQLSSPVTVNEGNTFIIPTGSLVIGFGGAYRQYLSNQLFQVTLQSTYGMIGIGPSTANYIALLHENWNEGIVTDYPYCSAAPDGAEVDATGYSRVLFQNWSAPFGGSCVNLSDIIFTTSAPSDWGDIKAIGLIEYAENNTGVTNPFFSFVANISPSATVLTGDSFTLKSGCVVIQLT